jgi:hypothetical protein
MNMNMDEEKVNPWAVEQLEDFQFFCCPECPDRIVTKETFIEHALANHPQSRDVLPNVEVTTVEVTTVEVTTATVTDIKEEILAECFIEELLPLSDDDYIPPTKKSCTPRQKTPGVTKTIKALETSNLETKVLPVTNAVQCYYCSEIFPKKYIVKHMKEVHNGSGRGRGRSQMYGEKRPYKCEMCNYSLLEERSESTHICVNPTFEKVAVPVTISAPISGFQCSQCNRSFFGQSGYNYHCATAHNDEKAFNCDKCGYTAQTDGLLQKHIQWVHEKQMSHVCHLCEKGCRSATVLKEHLVNFHKSATNLENTPMVACDLCTMTFHNVHGLNLHKTHYHDAPKNIRIPCEHCGKAFTKIDLLRLHQKSHHATEDQIAKVDCLCEKCNCTFTNAADLNVHLAMCLDDPKSFKCEHCAIGNWHSGIALRRHLAEVHQNVRDVCKICGQIMKAHFYLAQHMKVKHFDGKLIQCPQCIKQVKTMESLKKHINIVHKKLKPFKCPDCDMAFSTRKRLRDHAETIHNKVQVNNEGVILNKASFSCKHCQFVSNVVGTYHRHMRTEHPEEIPHKCDICLKGFFSLAKKNSHISVIHEKNKPFKCGKCDAAFSGSTLLYRHDHAKHIRATNDKCQQCSYSTYTPGALKMHVRYVHDKIKPHQCSYCNMAFTYKRDKEKHMSQLHGAYLGDSD